MVLTSMTLSSIDRLTVHGIRATGQKLFSASQESQAGHILSAAMAFIRSLAASALKIDPDDLTWKQVVLVMKQTHKDIIFLGELDLDRASAMGSPYTAKYDLAFSSMLSSKAAERALDIADLLLQADCTCCTQDRLMLAARGYYILMGAAFFAGNIMEACRVKWLLDRLEVKLPFFLKDDVRPPGSRKVMESMGSIHDIMNAFRSHKTLVDIPSVWRRVIDSCSKALCWYHACISCQDTDLHSHIAFQGAHQSIAINCGSYKAQPVFAIRHYKGESEIGPVYIYSIYTCRLGERKGKMDVLCLRDLKLGQLFTLGAVSGSFLYLTSFSAPTSGALLRIDLTKPDVIPEWTMSHPMPALQRNTMTMVALGGDLYVYGGYKETSDGGGLALSDILVARAQDGVVNQRWKQFAIKASDNLPPRRFLPCFFGHESPRGRLSLYLFGGALLTTSNVNSVEKTLNELWKLDIATGEWSELEQYGTRPCARLMTHGAFMSPDGQKALIAGGCTAFGCKHFSMVHKGPQDPDTIPLPDLFELDLNTSCWVPIVPKGERWTSAFKTCAGGYLASNRIGLTGLSRFGEGTGSDCADDDWTTAVTIKFQRGRETVGNILASSRQGVDRDKMLERLAQIKITHRIPLSKEPVNGPYFLTLMNMDRGQHACTVLTQHLKTTPTFAYTPYDKAFYQISDWIGCLLKGKQEVIADIGHSLKFPFKVPWLCSDLCPFSVGPHWLGGYNEVSTGVKLTEPPSKEERKGGAPWCETVHHAMRVFPTERAAVEYFKLVLPPWDASGGSNGWVKMKLGSEWRLADSLHTVRASEAAVLAYFPGSAPTESAVQEGLPIYVMGVTGNKFSALLVDLRGPSTRPEGPNRLLPNHVANIGAVTKSFQGLGAAWDYAGGTNYQSSYCGEGWDSWNRPIKPKPKVCKCQMARYCSQDCQFRHWAVHKPICKAARQPGGITQEQALAFMLS